MPRRAGRPYLYLLSGLDLRPIYSAIRQIPSCGIESPCVSRINEYGESAVENNRSDPLLIWVQGLQLDRKPPARQACA